METCDFAVVGLGVMGSAALAELSRYGRAIGFEAQAPGHGGGSSHGESRVFRLSSFENPGYTALAHRALETWRAIEREPGELYLRTGLIEVGAADSAIFAGRNRMPDMVGTAAGAEILPGFDFPEEWRVLFQPEAGILRADRAIARLTETAAARGAMVRRGAIASIAEGTDSVTLATAAGERVEAGAVVVTTGPWIARLVPELAGRLRVTLQTVGWFEPAKPEICSLETMLLFLVDTGAGLLYGFPDFAGLGVKAAMHSHGPAFDPDAPRPDAEADRAAIAPAAAALARFVPAAAGRLRATTTCLYTNTADEEFIVDRKPGSRRIAFASACSGHGFKFAPAIGAMLAELLLDSHATTPFGLDRHPA